MQINSFSLLTFDLKKLCQKSKLKQKSRLHYIDINANQVYIVIFYFIFLVGNNISGETADQLTEKLLIKGRVHVISSYSPFKEWHPLFYI